MIYFFQDRHLKYRFHMTEEVFGTWGESDAFFDIISFNEGEL